MFQHFPHIEQFHNVVKSVTEYPELLPKTDNLAFGMKTKLHGSNAAIQIRFDGPFSLKQKNYQVLAQSRSRIISSGDDNMGFARWMEDASHDWDWEDGLDSIYSLSYTEKKLLNIDTYPPVTIFGEWCGKGIMKGVAISEIDTKVFCVFAIQIGDSKDKDENAWVITDPSQIETLVPIHPEIKVIPFLSFIFGNQEGEPIVSEFISIDFDNPLDQIVKLMNRLVEDVEICDPFVKSEFGIEGLGEGIVFFPIIDRLPFIKRHFFSSLIFKAKGEKHKVTKQRNAIQIDPEVMASISEFIQKTVTEARLEQGAREVGRGELEFDMKKIGPFLAWIGNDVKRETTDELEASNLSWKDVQKNLQAEARTWYIAKCKEM